MRGVLSVDDISSNDNPCFFLTHSIYFPFSFSIVGTDYDVAELT